MSAVTAPTDPKARTTTAARLNLVAGRWVEGAGATSCSICNPADVAEELADVREASAAQVDEAGVSDRPQ